MLSDDVKLVVNTVVHDALSIFQGVAEGLQHLQPTLTRPLHLGGRNQNASVTNTSLLVALDDLSHPAQHAVPALADLGLEVLNLYLVDAPLFQLAAVHVVCVYSKNNSHLTLPLY